MQLIKALFSNPTALIVLFLILVIGLLIIAYYARKVSAATKKRSDNVKGFKMPYITNCDLSADFEERRLRRQANDSSVHADDWMIYSEIDYSEG